MCVGFFVHAPALVSWSFWNLGLGTFHLFWDVRGHYLFNYGFSPFSFPSASVST